MLLFLGIAAIVFFSVITNTVAGFGIALVAMPMLVPLVGIEVARPLMALLTFLSGAAIIVYYKRQLNLKDVWPLIIASAVGVPLGEVLLRLLSERLVTAGLGIIVVGYALYGLLGPTIPRIKREGWAYFYGFISGVLSGAYNTGGPPLVLYATSKGWGPAEFRGNLQAVGLVKGALVIGTHAVSGNFTPAVGQSLLVALPAVVVGSVAGFAIGDQLNPVVFRKVVLVLLVVLGVRLIIG
jgi:hypothetical protein